MLGIVVWPSISAQMIRIYIMVARQGKSRVSGDLYFMESKVLIFFFYPLNIYPPQKANRKTVNSDLDWYNAMTEYNEGDVEKALVEWVRSILILFFLVYFQPWWKGVIFFCFVLFYWHGWWGSFWSNSYTFYHPICSLLWSLPPKSKNH